MNRAQLPSGIATGIGSLPHRDAAAAAEFALTTLELPAIPTLPKRSPAEGMIPQALVGLAGITVGQYGSIAFDASSFDPAAPVVTCNLREPLEQLTLSLKSSLDYQIGSNRTASVFISDDENRPPILTAIQPSNNLRYPFSPTNLVFEVNAIDPDNGDAVTNVVLIANQNRVLGNWTNPPYLAIWTNPPTGSNSILAYAVDRLGAFSTSNLFSFYVNRPPQVQVQQPGEGQFFNSGTPSIFCASAI